MSSAQAEPLSESSRTGLAPASEFSLCKCPSDRRNLVLCTDGTANQFSIKNTNVVELYSRLIHDSKQLTYYNSGIGTYARPTYRSLSHIKQVVNHKIDMAIAWNFEKIVLAAYEWLSENYEPGDRIFLFGFSRGAYQVRVIAGMIERVGLLHKGNKHQIAFAYELYAATTDGAQREDSPGDVSTNMGKGSSGLFERFISVLRKRRKTEHEPRSTGSKGTPNSASAADGGTTEHKPSRREARGSDILHDPVQVKTKTTQPKKKASVLEAETLCVRFKQALSHEDFKVHFVGAWDTVSSVGTARGTSLPETTSGMAHVCVFRHALALDENRVKFLPEYANGGTGPAKGKGNVKEVWFAGSHSDIGGGSTLNKDLNNFGPALRWMTYEAISHGLRMKPYAGQWVTIKPTPSMTLFWALLELIPFRSLSYVEGSSTTHMPHFFKPRVVQSGQLIHESVFRHTPGSEDTGEGQYSPRARLNLQEAGIYSWDTAKVRAAKNPPGLLELDPFSSASLGIARLQKACDVISRSVPGQDRLWADFDSAVETLSQYVKTAGPSEQAPLFEVADAGGTLLTALEMEWNRRLSGSPPQQSKAIWVFVQVLAGFPPARSSKWRPSQIRKWTQSLGVQHQATIAKVIRNFADTFIQSRHIGGHIQSIDRSKQSEVLITTSTGYLSWDTSKPNPALGSFSLGLSFPEDTFLSTISSDGSLVAYYVPARGGTHKLTIQDLNNARRSPRVGSLPSSPDNAISFSHDNTWLASGCQNAGHTDLVGAVSFSPDNSKLASVSYDRTLRVWDVKSQKVLAVSNHDHPAISVTWSPSGGEIATGDIHGSIIVCDPDGRKKQSLNIMARAQYLAYSPDGCRIAVGSPGRYLRGVQVLECEGLSLLYPLEVDGCQGGLVFLDDGRLVLGRRSPSCIEIWDV